MRRVCRYAVVNANDNAVLTLRSANSAICISRVIAQTVNRRKIYLLYLLCIYCINKLGYVLQQCWCAMQSNADCQIAALPLLPVYYQ